MYVVKNEENCCYKIDNNVEKNVNSFVSQASINTQKQQTKDKFLINAIPYRETYNYLSATNKM